MKPLLAAAGSGFAALLFELLLFRRLELLLGRSVEASALVFAGYMAGLALGAVLALQPWSASRPRRWYIGLELWIGASGLLLVLASPAAAGLVAGLPEAVAAALLLAALLLPTVAMGWVLPLLAQAAVPDSAAFSRRFAWLYAANTLGALLGALAAVPLIRGLGLPPSAFIALAANLFAAALLWQSPLTGATPSASAATATPRWNLLAAAALSGALVLALEVVWLRAMLLQLRGTDWLLALLLAVVIGGISLGAMVNRLLPVGGWALLGLAGAFAGRELFGGLRQDGLSELAAAAWMSCVLALPVSIASGAVFAALAPALRRGAASSQRAGAALLVSNTLGAATGALLMAYWLLPWLGLARAWQICLPGFALLWLLLAPRPGRTVLALLIGAASLLMPDPSARWFAPALAQFPGYALVERREDRDASLQLASREMAGVPVAWRLITDGYSMSGTETDSLRYMRLFAQLPQALHPRIESALLISYGLGTTAEALLAHAELRQLQVVDTSAGTLALSRRVRSKDPLDDPRVKVEIDDGRHLLLRSPQRYDLITAEPPPPRLAGVVNLYSQDYFALARSRLRRGGLLSHWLPVDQLSTASSAAIIRAFCAEFPDCSLWAGSHYNWLLLGSAGGLPSGESLERLWRQPQARAFLQESGFERPGQLVTTFIADADQLQNWVGTGPVLDDDHPGRLESAPVRPDELLRYFDFMDDAATEQRFRASGWVRRWLSPAQRQQALSLWFWQPILNGQVRLGSEETAQLGALALREGLHAPLLHLLDLSWAELAVGAQLDGAAGQWFRGLDALLAGQWSQARQRLAEARHPAASVLAEVAACFDDGVCQVSGEGETQ